MKLFLFIFILSLSNVYTQKGMASEKCGSIDKSEIKSALDKKGNELCDCYKDQKQSQTLTQTKATDPGARTAPSIAQTDECKAATKFFDFYLNNNPKDIRFAKTAEMILQGCFKQNIYEDICQKNTNLQEFDALATILQFPNQNSTNQQECSQLAIDIYNASIKATNEKKEESNYQDAMKLAETFVKEQQKKNEEDKEKYERKIESKNTDAFNNLMSSIVSQVQGFINGKKYQNPYVSPHSDYKLPKSTATFPPRQKKESYGGYNEVYGEFIGLPTYVPRGVSLHKAQQFVKDPAYKNQIAAGCESSLGKKCSEDDMINFVQSPMQ